MKACQVAVRSLVEAEGPPAPLLDPIDAAFRRVALLVEVWVMADGATALRAALLATGCLVGLLRDDGLDVVSTQLGAVAAGGVRLIGGHRAGAGARAADGQADLDADSTARNFGLSPACLRGQDEGQRTAAPVGGQVDLVGQPTP